MFIISEIPSIPFSVFLNKINITHNAVTEKDYSCFLYGISIAWQKARTRAEAVGQHGLLKIQKDHREKEIKSAVTYG